MRNIEKQMEFAANLHQGIYGTKAEMKTCLEDFFAQYSEDPDAADSAHFIDTVADMTLNVAYISALEMLIQLGVIDSDVKYAWM